MPKEDNCLTVDVDEKGFDALEVLKSHSTKVKTLPRWIETVQYHIDPHGQAALGFNCYKCFVSNTELGTFVFAAMEYRNPNATTTITKNTFFTIEMKIKYQVKTEVESGMKIQWRDCTIAKLFRHVPLVDLVKCQFEDGSLVYSGLLCIPVEPCWAIVNKNPFQKLDQPFQVGVAIRGRHESIEAAEHLVHHNTNDDDFEKAEAWNSPSVTSGLWQFHEKENQEKYLLMCVTHGDSHPHPLTSVTPIKVKLILRSIAKYSSHLVPPYHVSTTIEPWYVKKENGFVHGLLAIPLRVSTEKEARFFEEVANNAESLRLEIITLEREFTRTQRE